MEKCRGKLFADLTGNSYVFLSVLLTLSWSRQIIYHVNPFACFLTNSSFIVIDNLRPLTNTFNAKEIGIIQFYFDDGDPNNQTVDDVIRSFIKQLVYQLKDGDIPKQLELLFDAEQEKPQN